MAYEVYGAEAAVEAVREFLQAGTHDGAGSPADTYNDVLAARRTTLGITTAALPDIAAFGTYWPRDEQAIQTPHLVVFWIDRALESLPPTGRSYDHRLGIGIFIAEADIAGDETVVGLAAIRYADALLAMFNRRGAGIQGATLNNGGTGPGKGRVIHAAVGPQGYEIGGATPNLLVTTDLRVRMSEVY